MTGDQLDRVVATTGHDRYRWLTSEANPDELQREAYRRLVERLAAGPLPPPRPVADLSGTRKAMRMGKLACLYAGPPACGCSGSHRCYALGRDATLRDCMVCLREVSWCG